MPSHTIPETLHQEYHDLVTALCRRMIQNRETARDAAQETWYEIVKCWPSFKNESSPSTWIYTVARRVILTYAKKERLYSTRFLRTHFESEAEPAGPDRQSPEHQLWVREMCDRCLTGILHCLDNETRLAYLFRDIADLPYSEIAQILERREADVRQIISRSRRKLNRFLNNQCILYNPKGACHCRMARHVQVHLPDEYRKIRQTMKRIRLFKASDRPLPGKKFWENFK